MTNWLEPLNLKSDILIDSSEQLGRDSTLPPWAAFLIWLGWWMHRTTVPERKIIVAVLLPTRICASAFCTLGCVLSAVSSDFGDVSDLFLTTDEIMELKPDTSVYIHKSDDESFFGHEVSKSIFKGVEVTEITGIGKTKFVRFDLLVSKKDEHRKSRLVPVDRLENFRISLELELTRRRLGRLERNYNFFNKLVRNCNQKWFLEGRMESLILTNRAWWKRHAVDISGAVDIGADISDTLKLEEILMITEEKIDHTRRSLLKSTRASLDTVGQDSLFVLDGREGLERVSDADYRNLIVLMEHAEFDQSANDTLKNISQMSRDDNEPPPHGMIPHELPSGIEMALYVLDRLEGVIE